MTLENEPPIRFTRKLRMLQDRHVTDIVEDYFLGQFVVIHVKIYMWHRSYCYKWSLPDFEHRLVDQAVLTLDDEPKYWPQYAHYRLRRVPNTNDWIICRVASITPAESTHPLIDKRT